LPEPHQDKLRNTQDAMDDSDVCNKPSLDDAQINVFSSLQNTQRNNAHLLHFLKCTHST